METAIASLLSAIRIAPRRVLLETPSVHATIPLLRGIWGAALHELDPAAYAATFPDEEGSRPQITPGYVLRPAPPHPLESPAFEWISIARAIEFDESLVRAWDVASGMGLGPDRHRFFVRQLRPLCPNLTVGSPTRLLTVWTLDESLWPVDGDPRSLPCRLRFPAPLRLLRGDRLIEQPRLEDIAIAGLRRVGAYLQPAAAADLRALHESIQELAPRIPASPWTGQRLDLVRYSGRQKRELELRGVAGYLDLPAGPGPLWRLLAALQWLHVGKGTTVGMGQLQIERLDT